MLFAPLLFGIIIGSTGPALDTMKNEVRNHANDILKLDVPHELVVFDSAKAAWFSALVSIGAIKGGLVSGMITKSIGYKGAIWVTIPLYIVSWFIMGYSKNWSLLLWARMATGLAVGINCFTVPSYISEVSPPHLRGILGASHQLSITVGILLVYFLGMFFRVSGGKVYSSTEQSIPLMDMLQGDSGTIGPQSPALMVSVFNEAPPNSFCNWRSLALFNLIPTFIFCVVLMFVPESPRWLASHGKLEDALVSLNTLRGGGHTEADVFGLVNMFTIKEGIVVAKRPDPVSYWDLLKCKRQMLIGLALQFFQQFSGINAIMFYCTTIMRKARVQHAEIVSVTVMFEQVIVTALACYLMDRAGRRILLITGAFVMAFACSMFGCYFALDSLGRNHNIIILVFVAAYTYMAGFSIGVGAIPFLILGEIIPPDLIPVGASLATTFNWICCFLVTISFEATANLISNQGVMWLFGVFCLGLVSFTAVFVPETKGKSPQEIQKYFASTSPPDEERTRLL